MHHIASTDAAVSRAEAAAMVSGWFLTSTPALSSVDGAVPAIAPDAGVSKATRQAGVGASAVLEVGGRILTAEERLLADDRCR